MLNCCLNFKRRDGENVAEIRTSLRVFFYHNEIQNFHLGLWVKAAFSSAQTEEKAHLNSRKNAFCMPTLSWPRFQSWWKNSLKPTTAELLTRNSDDQKRKMTP